MRGYLAKKYKEFVSISAKHNLQRAPNTSKTAKSNAIVYITVMTSLLELLSN